METIRRNSVRAAVLNDEGRVLLLHAVLPDEEWWELPGGGIDAGETEEDAVIRELREETGIHIDRPAGHLGAVETEFVFDGRRYLQRESVYLVRADSGKVRLVSPHVEHGWWRVADLAATDAEIHPPQLAELLRAP